MHEGQEPLAGEETMESLSQQEDGEPVPEKGRRKKVILLASCLFRLPGLFPGLLPGPPLDFCPLRFLPPGPLLDLCPLRLLSPGALLDFRPLRLLPPGFSLGFCPL